MDDFHARRPVNKTAARAVAKGEEYVPDKRIVDLESDTPLPVMRPDSLAFRNHKFENLTGKKFARLTVYGLSVNGGWVCRCACGKYCVRSAKAVKNPRNTVDACQTCRHLLFLKRRDLFNRGIERELEDLI